jgi:monovalent cation:H+ antiporter-2, CPA2 family
VLTRGELSLILAYLALAAGLDDRIAAFTAGYVLVLAFIGPFAVASSERLARLIPTRLFAEQPSRPSSPILEIDVGTSSLYQIGTDLLQIRISKGSKIHGVYVSELRLPAPTTLALLVRNGTPRSAGQATRLQENDVLLVFTTPGQREAVERRIRAVHRSGRTAKWQGDEGD